MKKAKWNWHVIKYCARCGCVTLGALTLLSRPHSDLINVVQVDTMAALFYRVALCALALFSLEVKGRPLA